MKKTLFLLFLATACITTMAQDTSWKKEYRETVPRINDLVHTKLDVKFDYENSYLNGKAWITLKPHFYKTDSLTLDAKGMGIHKVAMMNGAAMKDLKYEYDGWLLRINLGKNYKGGESYTIYIDYTAKPNEVKVKGSAAISDAKGLYFINPKGEEKDKPTQIWTQGETEASSVWFPTIDKPNQRTTQEIYMTVPAKYVTLSNGKLMTQKKNADGTRTDYWKMDLPHAPYLFFMGVGDFSIIKDSYKGKEVSYYVDKEYASVARKIFGNTPEMIAFFSKITGVDYPWVKYAQITGHDYVSGAMENTTATLHSDAAQQTARELVDGNFWESTIAHELFHQWFGDYVTTESWSNITLNESFANYSEVLWAEYKYGKDAGDDQNYGDMQGYLFSNSGKKDLVRFYYNDKEDVFDAVSYNKGGRILHMLRNYIGDSAFFKALNVYLATNKFKAAEAHQLRLAFEEVTGKDLNWYWNQWYFGAGHPSLDINYSYDNATKKARVIVKQTQAGDKVFKLPVAVDVYNGANKIRYTVWAKSKIDTFDFNTDRKPDLINFDGDKILLATKKENKTLDEYIHQYKYAGTYLDRREAIEAAAEQQDDPKAVELLNSALKDKYSGLRNLAMGSLNMSDDKVKAVVEKNIFDIAKNDSKPVVRAAAISYLNSYNNPENKDIFIKAINDSSYSVSGNALIALSEVDVPAAIAEMKELSKEPAKGVLANALKEVEALIDPDKSFDEMTTEYEALPLSQEKFQMTGTYTKLIGYIDNTGKVKSGVDLIVKFRDAIPAAFRSQTDPFINKALRDVMTKKLRSIQAGGNKEEITKQIEYIKSKLPEAERKGF
ncbi:MAG: M1 family metallopeptidase [Chitinophagaceae bacterium]|nr:M1 family metallopeptidase [Chitinophagaceae bacterium]